MAKKKPPEVERCVCPICGHRRMAIVPPDTPKGENGVRIYWCGRSNCGGLPRIAVRQQSRDLPGQKKLF